MRRHILPGLLAAGLMATAAEDKPDKTKRDTVEDRVMKVDPSGHLLTVKLNEKGKLPEPPKQDFPLDPATKFIFFRPGGEEGGGAQGSLPRRAAPRGGQGRSRLGRSVEGPGGPRRQSAESGRGQVGNQDTIRPADTPSMAGPILAKSGRVEFFRASFLYSGGQP